MDHDEVIEALTGPEGSVSAETRDAIDRHLASCDKDCREAAEGIALYREAGKRAEAETARILELAEAQEKAMAKLAARGDLTCAQVAAYRSGTEPLDEATRIRIARHCVDCPTCRTLDAVEAASSNREPRGEVVRFRTPRLRVAALLIVALGVGLLAGRVTEPEGHGTSLDPTDDIVAARLLKARHFDDQARVLARHFLDTYKDRPFPESVMREARDLAK